MRIEEEKRMRKSTIAVLLFIVATIALVLFAAVNARGIPILEFNGIIVVPRVATTYAMVPCANFQISGALKKVCAGPGSSIPENGEDRKSFEDNFTRMIIFAGNDLPFASWLYVVKPNPESPDMFVHLFDGEHIYAAGMGATFAEAMSDLRINFEEEKIAASSANAKKNDITI